MVKVLIVEDDIGLTELIKEAVEADGFEAISVQTADGAIELLSENTAYLMILDYSLPDMNGKEFLTALQKRALPIPAFIVSTGQGDERIAVEMMKLGARDYLIKNTHFLEILPEVIKRVSREIENEDKLKQAEDKLRLSNLRNIAMISNISDVIGIIGIDGLVKYKSPNIEKWFGWQPKDLVGTDCFSNVHPEDLERMQKIFTTLLERDNISSSMELKYRCKDGRYKPINLTATNLTNDPNINGVLINYHDITERKEADQKLINLQELFRKTESIGKIGGWEFDVATMTRTWTDETFRIMEIDTTHGEPKVPDGIGFIDQPFRDRAEKAIQEAIQNGKGYDQEWRITTAKGNKRWVHSVSNATVKNGKVVSVSGSFQDITDRKQAEDDLKLAKEKAEESEETFRKLFDDSSDAILLIDKTGVFVECNQAALVLLKMTREQFLYKPPVDISPEYQPDGQSSEKKALKMIEMAYEKGLHRFDWTCINSEGGEFIVEVSLMPIKVKGEIMLHTTWRDITERISQEKELKKAKEKAEESEQRFLLAMNASHDGLFDWNLESNAIYYSPGWKKMLGYEDHELPNDFSVWEDMTAPEDLKKSWELQQKLVSRQIDRFVLEFKMKHKDGHWVDILSRAKAIFNDKGKAIRIVGTHTDISERKQAESELRFTSTVLSMFIKNSPIYAFLKEVTKTESRSVFLSDNYINMIGIPAEDAIGKTMSELFQDEMAKMITADDIAVVTKDKKIVIEEAYNGKNYITYKFPIMTNGKKYLAGFTIDITERKQAEEALLRQERLSAIGELASGVAHDFNNALQIIMGGVEMAMVSEEPEELNHYLESIKHSAGDAASRVRQLQQFSQKSQAQKESVAIDINKLINEVVKETKLFINQYQEKGIHIEVKSDYKAKSNIAGVEGELRACLFNLIKNSAEAMPGGGEIAIVTEEHDGNVYVSVSDTGTGMDKETQKKVFQPFFSTKGFEPGRGLGMAQVYSTIRDHNGDVYIKACEIGNGTEIEFSLPISKKEPIPEKKEKDYSGSANILWVDDEEMILDFGKKMVKKLGHSGDFAANGEEALALLAQGNRYDLVITDIGMPGMSGWQLAEEIRNKGYTTRIAVVTGWGAEVSQEDKEKYNVGYLLGKPILLKDLKALIGEVLQMKKMSRKECKNE